MRTVSVRNSVVRLIADNRERRGGSLGGRWSDGVREIQFIDIKDYSGSYARAKDLSSSGTAFIFVDGF